MCFSRSACMIGWKFHLVSFTINSGLSSYNSHFYSVPVLQYCILSTHLWHWLENMKGKTMQDGLNCFLSLWVGQLIEYTNLSICFSPSLSSSQRLQITHKFWPPSSHIYLWSPVSTNMYNLFKLSPTCLSVLHISFFFFSPFPFLSFPLLIYTYIHISS
jgi:hypothetical protein